LAIYPPQSMQLPTSNQYISVTKQWR